VQYYRPDLYLSAKNGEVNIRKETGEFNQIRYQVMTNGARGQAKRIIALGNQKYALSDVDYSTCAGTTKAWQLSAARIDLNRDTGRGVAHDATLRFYGVPILYTPYINFPIDNKRHTGFITPIVGHSGDSGFELAAPYYINLAPNYDATLVPRALSARGFQLGTQFRYLAAHQHGEFDGAYLPYDYKYGGDRSFVHFEHIGRFNPHVGVEANYNRVSDDNYFDDLSDDLTHTSTSQLERMGRLTLADTGVRFTLLAQNFQTLDRSNSIFSNNPYARAPQATLEMLSPTAPFQVGLDAQFTRFQRSDSIDAERIDARPRLLWSADHGGWFANSEAAYRLTRYDLSNLDANRADNAAYNQYLPQPHKHAIGRGIPSFKIGSGLRFSRALDNGWIQTLEPRVQYLYVGYENQSDIPVFDAGVPDLHYERLFATNRFTGIDRIGDANQITLGVTSRFIEPKSGRTVLKLDAGRVTSFRDLKVNVPNDGETGYSNRGSDYVAGIEFQPTDNLRAQATLQYDAHDNRIDRALATASYTSAAGYQLDLGYRFYRDFRPLRDTSDLGRHDHTIDFIPGQFETLQQTVLGVRAPVTDRFDVVARWNYSLKRSQNVETLAGFEYRPSCCWAARLAVRHYVANDNGHQDTAVLFQFVLQGLGRFGKRIRSFVSRSVFSSLNGRSNASFDTIHFP
jgi:LPS-assembly protein